MEYSSISEAFRCVRSEHGLSQKDPWVVGVSRVTVINIESGKTECSSYVILRLMQIFGFTIEVDTAAMKNKLEQLAKRNKDMQVARTLGLSVRGFR